VQQRGGGAQRGQPIRVVEQAGGVRRDQLAIDGAEMLGEAAAPLHRDGIARLQEGAAARCLAATHQPRFLVPLGLTLWFASVGIPVAQEPDWWDSVRVGDVTFTATPVQHWSSRTPFDMNRRLWAGWAVTAGARRLFFAGDTGYYDGFRRIGERLGPFDLALVSIAAYEPPSIMAHTHTTPEEALRIFADVRARTFVAMHWGTFDLAEEPIDEPPRRLVAAARAQGLPDARVWVLGHGETRPW